MMDRPIRCTFLLATVLVCALSASGQMTGTTKATTATKATPRTATPQSEFKALIERYYAAWNTGNPEEAAPLYAKDADLVFYDITPLKYTGWAEYAEGVRKVIGSFASVKFTTHDDLKVTRRGRIAWTTVTFHMSGKKQTGEAVELDGRHTAIWEARGGKWLIVHEHFSAPLS